MEVNQETEKKKSRHSSFYEGFGSTISNLVSPHSSFNSSAIKLSSTPIVNYRNDIIFHGTVVKFPRDLKFGFQKERYLVLRIDGSLFYYSDEAAYSNDEDPCGVLYLGENSTVEELTRRKHRTNLFSEKIFVISVTAGAGHELVFSTSSSSNIDDKSLSTFSSSSFISNTSNQAERKISGAGNINEREEQIEEREDRREERPLRDHVPLRNENHLLWYNSISDVVSSIKSKYSDTLVYPKGENTTLHEGWMYHFSNGMGNISMRYFVLTPHRLSYYITDTEYKCGGPAKKFHNITMDTKIVRKKVERIKESGVTGMVKDKINANKREMTELLECTNLGDFHDGFKAVLKFQTRTPNEAVDWVDKITLAAYNLRLKDILVENKQRSNSRHEENESNHYGENLVLNDGVSKNVKEEGWVYIFPSNNIQIEEENLITNEETAMQINLKKKPKKRYFQLVNKEVLYIFKDEHTSPSINNEMKETPIVVNLVNNDTKPKLRQIKVKYKSPNEDTFSVIEMIEFDNPTIDKFYFCDGLKTKTELDKWLFSFNRIVCKNEQNQDPPRHHRSRSSTGNTTTSPVRYRSRSGANNLGDNHDRSELRSPRVTSTEKENKDQSTITSNKSSTSSSSAPTAPSPAPVPIHVKVNRRSSLSESEIFVDSNSIPSNSNSNPNPSSNSNANSNSNLNSNANSKSTSIHRTSSPSVESIKTRSKSNSKTSSSLAPSPTVFVDPFLSSTRVKEYHEARQHQQDVEEVRNMLIEDTRNEVKGWSHKKEIGVLLYDLGTIWPEYKNTCQEIIEVKPGVHSIAPSKMKITYLKALKYIHPDKTANLTLDKQILAQEIFIKLNDKYTKYTEKHR